MKDVERALEELIKRGLLTRNETGAGVTYGAGSEVAREIAHWMQAHPEEKEGLSDERVASELGQWYAASFEKLADAGGSDATEQAAGEARAALHCYLQAQAFGDLGAFASRLVTGARDPELLGQVVDDFTASGVPVIFADYRLRRLIGAGTTSSVYEAERVDNAMPVAIKVLGGKWPDEEVDVLRFLDDAKLANRVRHPNVVEVFDAGHAEGTRFVAMELLRGRSLERRWRAKGRRFPLKRVLEVAMHVLGVLAAAHEKSIIHGSVRPSNIFITSDGSVKILDFGFESLTRPARPRPPSSDDFLPLSFLAPEQIRGELPDPRTDLWSVGSTMFALLSGHPADPTRTEPLASVLSSVPRNVVAILDRALRPARDERWQSAQEMWEAIAEIHGELPDPDEHHSDPGPGVVPLVEMHAAGPLSERIEIDVDEERRPASARPPPMLSVAANDVGVVAAAPVSPQPQPPTAVLAPASPADKSSGVSKPVLFVAALAIIVGAIAMTLRLSASNDVPRPPPPPTATAPSRTAAPTTPLPADVPTTPTVLQANPDGPPPPISTDVAPLSSGEIKNGDKCESAAECKSGQCVDGVCCASACTGTCVACNLKSFLGMCAEIPYGYDPDRECTPKVCDGDGSCGEKKINGKRCKAGRECGSNYCVRGVCCATECRGADGNCSTGICRRSLLIE